MKCIYCNNECEPAFENKTWFRINADTALHGECAKKAGIAIKIAHVLMNVFADIIKRQASKAKQAKPKRKPLRNKKK